MSDGALPPVLRRKEDVGPRFMLGFLGLVGVCLVLIVGLATLLFRPSLQDRRFATPFPQFPTPVLQPSPPVDMRIFAAEEMLRLNGADWIDRAAGTAHIPIEQAMRVVAAEGIAGWPTTAAAASTDRRR